MYVQFIVAETQTACSYKSKANQLLRENAT